MHLRSITQCFAMSASLTALACGSSADKDPDETPAGLQPEPNSQPLSGCPRAEDEVRR